jgi:hypothetical protein
LRRPPLEAATIALPPEEAAASASFAAFLALLVVDLSTSANMPWSAIFDLAMIDMDVARRLISGFSLVRADVKAVIPASMPGNPPLTKFSAPATLVNDAAMVSAALITCSAPTTPNSMPILWLISPPLYDCSIALRSNSTCFLYLFHMIRLSDDGQLMISLLDCFKCHMRLKISWSKSSMSYRTGRQRGDRSLNMLFISFRDIP